MKNAPKIVTYQPYLWIVLLAFAIYGNSLFNDYALDDLLAIKANTFTQKGISGIPDIFAYDSFTGFFGIQKKLVAGGRYRPLSIATFAMEYGLFGGFHPGISHFINILLYALTGLVLFRVLSRLIKPSPGKRPWYLEIPFLATLLFIAHPIHTEVVANIKGRDEIFALLFSLLALQSVLNYHSLKKPLHLAYASAWIFLGLLSKENTITFLAIIPLTVHFFTATPLRKNLFSVLPLASAALLFLFIRFLVLGYVNSNEIPRELLNNPFLDATTAQKYGTILMTLGMYVKLLIFPHPLTHDYYPYQVPLAGFDDWRVILSFVVNAGLLVMAVVLFRRKHLVSYGILFYFITLFIVSNIVFPVGTFMNERFVYMPSVGFVLIVAWLLNRKLMPSVKNPATGNKLIMGVMVIFLLLYSVKTIARNTTWYDDFTLFSTDVKVSVNSTKCNTSAGGKYLEKAQAETDTALQRQDFEHSLRYLARALEIYPGNKNALLLQGNVYSLYYHDQKAAIGNYLYVMQMEGYNNNAFNNALLLLTKMTEPKETDYRISILKKLESYKPESDEVQYLIGKMYGQYKGNLDSAEYFLRKAISLNPTNSGPFKDLGVIYGMRKQYKEAEEVLSKALQLDPQDNQVRQNLALTRQLLEQQKK
jgi:protein O-mannosyl-transferase